MDQADHYVRDLNPGVVDVVLYIDLLARRLEQAHKRVAQNGIAQMADVRRLVGIDAGMLHQRMQRAQRRRFSISRQNFAHCPATIQPCIDIPCAGNLKGLKARN